MAVHSFSIGDIVSFQPNISLEGSGVYEIIRLLPMNGPAPLYLIRSIGEPFGRVARERELNAVKAASRISASPAKPIAQKSSAKPRL